jgi:hypothetical protein
MENLTCEIAYIYGLVDPRNNKIRYIGKTIDPKNRLSGHITESKDISVINYRIKWIRKLISLDIKPKIVYLKVCSILEFVKYETEYIKIYSNNRLTNSDETGQGNTNRKREVLERQSENSGREVYQYDLNGIFLKKFRSTRTAAYELKLSHGNISRCCNGIFKHTGGYIFKYDKKFVDKVIKPNAIKKIVIEVDTDGLEINRWNSLMDCSRSIGIDNGNISRVCNGKRHSIKKRIFRFL